MSSLLSPILKAFSVDLHAALTEHRVIIIEGPPGSGKSTEVPRLLWHGGWIKRCLGITQPRRIAAVGVAQRIANLESLTLGQQIGYTVRFDDKSSANTRIKVMTDGILLQEARHDDLLSAYDMLMVDEAHERSVNIDFTLGLLHMVLQRRPDFKVIISSATLNPKVFQRFFSAIEANIPVLRLQHHAFPVQVHYAPPPSRAPEVLLERVVQLTRKVVAPGKTGHLLIFLPGEGWIHTLTDALRAEGLDRYCWILPLYARLKTEDQHRVFAPAPQGKQKVILATNLAETSITIPGIQYVLDTGLAKIPSYDADTGITSLRECFVSQAAAKQRMGRAGRTEAGEVWRLYHADELKAQPSYHPEEILRSDLSEIVLHLVDLGIQKPTTFPLPTPPPKSKIYAAIDKLRYLGAIDRHTRLTDIGREMVRFPLSPTIARMLVAGIHQAPHALHSVLQMSSLLSARSPLLYPPGEEDEARHQQKRFRSPWGDTMMLLNAYQAFLASAHRLEFCKKFYLDYEILTFTQHVYDQLARICTQHGIAIESGHVEPETLVFCLATGFSEKILRHERGPIYRNSQGIAIALHPGSCLFRTPPAWAVATEWVAHKRPMAMQVSRIKEEWLDHGLEAETSASTTSTKATSTKAASAKAASTKAASAKAASSRRHLA